MIFIIENGRLGNQLLQFHAIKNIYPHHRIILIGFSQLQSLCYLKNTIFIKNKLLKFTTKILIKILVFFNIISLGCEDYNNKINIIRKKLNIFNKNLILVNGFFQNAKFIENLSQSIFIRKRWENTAESIFSNLKTLNNNSELVFIHIRRGDYVSWPSIDSPALVPYAWYVSAMNYFAKKLKNPKFVIFTDDLDYVVKNFQNVNNIYIVHNSLEIDFTVMSMFSYGILSPSTYSLCASLIANEKNPNSYFLAPKFWAGFNSGSWYPKKIQTNWIHYLNVF